MSPTLSAEAPNSRDRSSCSSWPAARLALTYTQGRITQRIGIVVIGIWGASFALGDLTQLFQHNDGISSGRWDVVLAGAVVGMVLGIITVTCAVRLLVAQRRERRLGQVGAA